MEICLHANATEVNGILFVVLTALKNHILENDACFVICGFRIFELKGS